jgi:hypothetical protein
VRLHCILVKTYHRIICCLTRTVGRYSETSLLCEEWRYNILPGIFDFLKIFSLFLLKEEALFVPCREEYG